MTLADDVVAKLNREDEMEQIVRRIVLLIDGIRKDGGRGPLHGMDFHGCGPRKAVGFFFYAGVRKPEILLIDEVGRAAWKGEITGGIPSYAVRIVYEALDDLIRQARHSIPRLDSRLDELGIAYTS